MNTNHQNQENNSHGQTDMGKMREFAYRAPSPDSEPPTMQEESESQETEGAAAAADSDKPVDMEEALARDPSPDDLDIVPPSERQ